MQNSRFCSRARREEVKKRSVLGVHEHFSPTSNAAIGQKMGFTSGSEEFVKNPFCYLYYVSFG